MKSRVLILIGCLFFGGAVHVNAQQTRSLSLKEAIDLSVSNSKQLRLNKAKIDEASASLKEALERRLPDASVSASYLRLTSPHIDLKSKSSGGTGGAEPAASPSPSSAAYGMASVSLPLYAGYKIKYGIQSSEYLERAAKLDAADQREEVMLNTITAYDNLYKSRAAVDLVKENLEGNRQRVRDFSNLEKNGLLARNELLKAQLQESNTELALMDAENNWRLANLNMNLMLGLPDSTTLVVNEADLSAAPSSLKPVDDFVTQGLQNRKDIAALGFRRKAASTGVKAAKAGSYPSVALTGGYVAANVPNVLTVTNAINLGLGVQYNITSLWKNGSLDVAKAREKQVAANEEMMQDGIRLEISQAYQNYLSARKKIEVYDKAIQQAEENNRIVKNKFNNQLATTTDLLDADVALLQTRLNAAFAKADASVAYNKLLQTAGMLDTAATK